MSEESPAPPELLGEALAKTGDEPGEYPEYVVEIGVTHVEDEILVVHLNGDMYALPMRDIESLCGKAHEAMNDDDDGVEVEL